MKKANQTDIRILDFEKQQIVIIPLHYNTHTRESSECRAVGVRTKQKQNNNTDAKTDWAKSETATTI